MPAYDVWHIRRPVRLLGLLVSAVLLTVIAVPVGAGFAFTATLLSPPCDDHGATPADLGYAYEDVTLAARAGGHFRAFFIPGGRDDTGPNGAAIIIPPAYGGGRDSNLPDAGVLARHGYSVLIFESRRCAGMGRLSLGYNEMDEVADALAYLLTRPEIDPARIGVLGFSSSGATAVMAAARMPELHAVIAEGGYGDLAEGAFGTAGHGALLTLYEWSVRASYRLLSGVSLDKLSPLDVIDQIAPRPILLIYGSREITLEGARQQLARAGDNATLWVVEGAGHGQYLERAPVEYEQHVIAFFDGALLGVDDRLME